eukprot:s295_g9.t1
MGVGYGKSVLVWVTASVALRYVTDAAVNAAAPKTGSMLAVEMWPGPNPCRSNEDREDSLVAELGLTTHFQNIPSSMFTAFRCFSGECFAASGLPIAAVLEDSHGLPFVLGYVVCCLADRLLCTEPRDLDLTLKSEQMPLDIRHLPLEGELLKKFAAAYRQFQDLDENETSNKKHLDFSPMESNFTDEDIHGHIAITKELFLLVIQDQSVQFLMDELELPHDRANLFEIIDADGSGTLHVTELVQGLLKIRGEVKKSDAVATLLATKAIQNQLVEAWSHC